MMNPYLLHALARERLAGLRTETAAHHPAKPEARTHSARTSRRISRRLKTRRPRPV